MKLQKDTGDSGRVPLLVKPEVVTAMAMKITAFWEATPCHFIDRYQHFGGTIFRITDRGRRQVRAKYWYLSTKRHSVTPQNIAIFIVYT
jgi:hypothetical protein